MMATATPNSFPAFIPASSLADAKAWLDRGEGAQLADAFELAESHFNRAVALAPTLVAALIARGELRLSLGRVDEAERDLEAAVLADPSFHDVETKRAKAMLRVIRHADDV